ncbi:MAG: hypothetical protein M5U14_16745 [Acidimicrobiia bacterium]|nr:hypothetical protein [Acidimicrobiia bacterium]
MTGLASKLIGASVLAAVVGGLAGLHGGLEREARGLEPGRVTSASAAPGTEAPVTAASLAALASREDVFAMGDAGQHGSTGAMDLTRPIVGMAATPSGGGYWLVASDGGIFAFGDAAFHGSTGSVALNRPIVGMAATPSGSGYWLVASDGGIFAFGDAAFHGSTGSVALNRPIVGMAATPSGGGYWLVASDGGSSRSATRPSTGRWGRWR